MKVRYREGDSADLATEGFVEWIDLGHLCVSWISEVTYPMCEAVSGTASRAHLSDVGRDLDPVDVSSSSFWHEVSHLPSQRLKDKHRVDRVLIRQGFW